MKKLKVLTVVGTRPEIIRLACVLNALDANDAIDHTLVHTGQNYDYELNEIFFEDLGIRKPDHFLNAAGKNATETVGKILIAIDPVLEQIEGAKATGTDRIELYTEAFAHQYSLGNKDAILPYTESAELANSLDLGINAGHDLSLDNIKFFKENIPDLLEVSIGHALIAESLYLGVENVVQMYLHKLK